ncbi:MAG TPA: hypothetical protein VFZ21_31025 [Gemmatimonadaceae bacterium]|nr:hypothetical protein [Gemmatimonadaceae bacterium]
MTPKRRFAVGTVHYLAGGLAFEVVAHVVTKRGRIERIELLSSSGMALLRVTPEWAKFHLRSNR